MILDINSNICLNLLQLFSLFHIPTVEIKDYTETSELTPLRQFDLLGEGETWILEGNSGIALFKNSLYIIKVDIHKDNFKLLLSVAPWIRTKIIRVEFE